jgi:hypothetical protein
MRLSFGMLKWISRMLAKRDHLLRRDTGSRHRAHLPGDDDRESEG